MNFTNNNYDQSASFNSSSFSQQKLLTNSPESTRQTIIHSSKQHKILSDTQIIEISMLCLILIEHTIIFLLTFQKKTSKEILFDINDQQQQRRQTHQARSIIIPSKSFLYNCLHRNWIRAYSFSNICLSFVYFIILILKHYHPNLLHHSSITFYSLPLTLVQQIIINFSTFHLLIISISILQYFIRYYRLLKMEDSLNIYSGRNLLITKHTNVALILSGSLALIFSYNYIFYLPTNPSTIALLPLITLNMILLPLIDFLIFIFIIICCIINLYKSISSIKRDCSFDDQLEQNHHLTNNLRSTIEKATCTKCYSKVLEKNRNLFKDTESYTKLHSKFFSHKLISSARPSLTLPEDKRKYSTISYENIPMATDVHSRLRASYPCQPARIKSDRSQDLPVEQRTDGERMSTNDLILQPILLKLKRQRSLCHLCYRLLLIFLLKYVLLIFPQHFIHMKFYVRQFYKYLSKQNSLSNNILSEYSESTVIICRFLFLFARFGDILLLTRLPNIIKNYFPCWCHFDSKFLRRKKPFQRPSHQILMKNTDSSTNERLSGDEPSNANDVNGTNQQQPSCTRQSIRTNRRHFRLRFQFIPLWSNKRQRLYKGNY